MPRKAKPPSFPAFNIVEVYREAEAEREAYQAALQSMPGWAEGIIFGLLARVPGRQGEALIERVKYLILEGPHRQAQEGREALKNHAVQELRGFRFDPRRGGNHSDLVLRAHASLIWHVVEQAPLASRNRTNLLLWLRECLPSLLQRMTEGMWRCHERCSASTHVPDGSTLQRWSAIRRVKPLAHEILAHHHGLKLSTLERYLKRKT